MTAAYPARVMAVARSWARRFHTQWLIWAVCLGLGACSTTAPRGPTGSTRPAPPGAQPLDPGTAALDRSVGRWVRVAWDELPGVGETSLANAASGILRNCQRAPGAWAEACRDAKGLDVRDETAVRLWMFKHLQPWRVEDTRMGAQGLLTGYYEPQFEARRVADGEFKTPLYAAPADLNRRRPYWSRQELDTVPEARASLQGRAIAFVRHPVDALILQVQGSGRLLLTEPDGAQNLVRLRFAGHNDHPFQSVGKWLVDRGWLTSAQSSWTGLRDWMLRNPRRVQEALWANPRVIFFQEEPLGNGDEGPRGAMGIPLLPEASIAVDTRSIPYGAAVWLVAHLPGATKPELQGLAWAQDTGSAIAGAVRADFFWGWGDRAERQANRTRHALRLWVLWPRGYSPPP